jgi:hypothetical protein
MKTFEEFFEEVEQELEENYTDGKYDPKKMEKELPKGYSYGDKEHGKGDHTRHTLKVNGTDTDIKIGGASSGKGKYSPSYGDGHRSAKKVIDGIDREVKSIQGKKADTADRMKKAHDRNVASAGKKALGDITGKGHTASARGKGNKAARRIK